jgi:prepilin-type N-terminal cleavage/methylation domain-containing protein
MKRANQGLTLVEMMLVLLLLGITTTLALPAFDSVRRETKLDGAAAWLLGDIRYAQSLAIHTQQTCTIAFDPVNESYRLLDQNGVLVQHPMTRQSYQVNLKTMQQFQGIDLVSATFGASSNLSFGTLGAPQTGGTVTLSYANRQRVITVIYPSGRIMLP